MGATYTPPAIVAAMLGWADGRVRPARVVDPGAGSGRFVVAAGRHYPEAELVAVDVDPLASILARGHLAAAGLAGRARVVLGDYREIALPAAGGPTLFIGNPPYVRHHLIAPRWKAWLVDTARRHGIAASQLAGLHAHFFLAIAEHGRPGDAGVLITAAEWLDVNYGRLVRELLLGPLGAASLHVIEPSAELFPGTQATAVIAAFNVGTRPGSIGVRRVATADDLGALETERSVPRERFAATSRWSALTLPGRERRADYVELGEICRVHRGQVTGANRVWIVGPDGADLPASVLYPTVTRARELFATDGALVDASGLRRVIDLPVDLDVFDQIDRASVERFLRRAEAQGAAAGFIARHRKAWWSVGLRQPAPILATYMARRPPVFVRNPVEARHINIAHGLYPRGTLAPDQLAALAAVLSRGVTLQDGRTYAGGLTKFEPREMERLLVPRPELLADWLDVEAGNRIAA